MRVRAWLFSLERSKQALVEAAKRSLRLPAYRARMTVVPGSVDVERDGSSRSVTVTLGRRPNRIP